MTFFSKNKNLCKNCRIPFLLSGGKFTKAVQLKIELRTYKETTALSSLDNSFRVDYV